jgi:transposase
MSAPPCIAALIAVRQNPVLKPCYVRQRTASRVAKMTLITCMPKLLAILNARLKHQAPWRMNHAPTP